MLKLTELWSGSTLKTTGAAATRVGTASASSSATTNFLLINLISSRDVVWQSSTTLPIAEHNSRSPGVIPLRPAPVQGGHLQEVIGSGLPRSIPSSPTAWAT